MTAEQNTEALKKARTFSYNKDKIDGFYNGYVQATIELQKQIRIDAEHIIALQKQNGELTDKVNDLEEKLANADYQLEGRDNEVRELKEQIEKMKRCEICKHYQWNHCSYEINISKDCIQNKLKHFELKEIKEK